MADWTQPNDIDPSNGGDDVYEGFVKADNNFVDVYSKLTTLRKLEAAASPNTNDVRHNTTDHKLYYWSGAAWTAIETDAGEYTSGLSMEAGIKGFSQNVFLNYASNKIQLLASTNSLPATVEIDGSLYQVTADIEIDIAAKAAGVHFVHAEPDTGSTFKLAVTTNASESGKTLVGWFRVVSTGVAENSMVASKEAQVRQDFFVKATGTLTGTVTIGAQATYQAMQDGTVMNLEKTVAVGPDSDLIIAVQCPPIDDLAGSGHKAYLNIDVDGDLIGAVAGNSNHAAVYQLRDSAQQTGPIFTRRVRLPGAGAVVLIPAIDRNDSMEFDFGAASFQIPWMRIQEVKHYGTAQNSGNVPIDSD